MAYPEYSNIELFQGEDFIMSVDLSSDAAYTTVYKSYKAQLVSSYSDTSALKEFIVSDVDSTAKTMNLKLTKDQTQSLTDDFDGYWDLLEKEINMGQLKVTQATGGGLEYVSIVAPGGFGYVIGTAIVVLGGTGTLAKVSIDTVDGIGSITGVTVTNAGINYVVDDILNVVGGSKYTRLLQGEAKVFPQITKDEDW